MIVTARGTVWLTLGALLIACAPPVGTVVVGGDRSRGQQSLALMGCGGCHAIPGVQGARGIVGPPLSDVARRTMIAGEIPNSPENMIRWIRNPQEIEPGTAMPNLHVSEQSARDMAAYLYSLR